MRTVVPTFLALSRAPRETVRGQERLAHAIEVVACHARTTPHVVRHGSLVVAVSHPSLRVGTATRDVYPLSHPPGAPLSSDVRFPPFAQAAVDLAGQSVSVVVDACGLRHVYWVQGDQWAAVSTSSSVLAAVAGTDLDEWSLATLALCGNLLGSSTPYRSVRKMPPASTLVLASGRGTLDTTAPQIPERSIVPDERQLARSVREGVQVISTAVRDLVDDHPDAQLELSGGLDSRMLLAALRGHRTNVRAITLDHPGGSESSIAAQLAEIAGLDHRVVNMRGLDRLTDDEAGALVSAASHRRDHSGNPLAGAVLDWVEGQLEQGPRLTGQNGEYCRGFYYAAQRQSARTTPQAARRLATWRMFTNDSVDPSLFHDEFIQEARTRTVEEIASILTGYEKPWLEATDEFYLRERMQRWVGLGFSDACMSRPLLAPFFHPQYLRWSAASDPADKRNSRLFSMVLRDLWPELASLPLSNRPAPATLADARLRDRVRQLGTTTSKGVGKLRQKISATGRPAGGTARLALLQQAFWRRRPELLEGVASLPFVDASVVERLAAGHATISPASVAFVATLRGICDVTAANTHTARP